MARATPAAKRPRGAPEGSTRLAALYARLLEDPHDLATRAVYADALLEAGDPRGELITLQLRRGVIGTPSAREKALEKALWAGALAPLREVLDKRYSKLEHGFMTRARLNAYREPMTREQLDHPEWPFVRALEVIGVSDYPHIQREVPELLDRIPHLAELHIDSRECLPLAGAKPRPRLVHLNVFLHKYDDLAPLEKLVAAGRFPALRRLGFWNYEASAKRLVALAKSLPALERLDVFVTASDRTRDHGAAKQLATLLAAVPSVGVSSQWGGATLTRGTIPRIGFTEVRRLPNFGNDDPLPYVRALVSALGDVTVAADTKSRAVKAAVDMLVDAGHPRA